MATIGTLANRSRLALDDNAYSVWLAVFVLFLTWWLLQLVLYGMRAVRARSEPSVQLPILEEIERPARDTEWLGKVEAARKAARDTFLMLFPAAVLITAVGGDYTLTVLTWVFFLLAIFWQLGALATESPSVHAAFTLLSLALLIGIFVLALKRAP
ncbi:uncharacterized protein SPPG_06520 [Spizellomyces punctatus DAOM BR117]|uniref:MAPEG family protein n=1 Tax=Spizellomyces punctatus (strain DAOM BR117) TaxID=645134 RepID=A0A0L0HB09_SPIPD|nr:uncharacterized protein SPPG_06520 [Spizellomyces punctatus DAOM BR117]KNC98111.1 hypothetical protein SPPG_06520 [Spizellomyces punctatus DAOM BR117]|eukprot:XP_016606151.1 hypothetical protein SPPG_06520 [Spizellomyces punctatus DAOM BR117]